MTLRATIGGHTAQQVDFAAELNRKGRALQYALKRLRPALGTASPRMHVLRVGLRMGPCIPRPGGRHTTKVIEGGIESEVETGFHRLFAEIPEYASLVILDFFL